MTEYPIVYNFTSKTIYRTYEINIFVTAWIHEREVLRHQLSRIPGKITEATDKGTATDIIYLDFAKAFDKVPTEQLLRKVESQ